MNYYLIDFENVRCNGIKDFCGIKKGDSIIIFYSETCKNITIDVMENISALNLQFKSFKAKTGTKNALDFQLSSYIGYLIGKNSKNGENNSYYIVSKDKGFDCLCDFWNALGYSVKKISLQKDEMTAKDPVDKLTPPSAATPKKKKSKVDENALATLQDIQTYLDEEDSPDEVVMIFNQFKTKTAINNGLVKLYGDTKMAGAVYKKLKPLLKEKKKN